MLAESSLHVPLLTFYQGRFSMLDYRTCTYITTITEVPLHCNQTGLSRYNRKKFHSCVYCCASTTCQLLQWLQFYSNILHICPGQEGVGVTSLLFHSFLQLLFLALHIGTITQLVTKGPNWLIYLATRAFTKYTVSSEKNRISYHVVQILTFVQDYLMKRT